WPTIMSVKAPTPIAFWQAHRDLAPKTAHAYWLTLCVIWEWTDKPGQPPKPLCIVKTISDGTDD
ncbi:hypothetical protein, partial [Methylomonas koyamae]|uniref:hypothetical protein n=1 Tax=Methylomonas koyamae TaxID=702114 RepID=UPI001E30060E